MTGNFKLRTVENKIETEGRWIVHKENINEMKKSFHNLKNFNRLKENPPSRMTLKFLETRSVYPGISTMYEHDVIRPLNIEEYFILERFLRRLNRRYNKKQDKLIKVL